MPIDPAIRNLLKPLPDKPVHSLNKKQMAHFRRLIGWEEGPVVPYPITAEQTVRKQRETWKRQHAGNGRPEPCLLYREEHIARFKKNVRTDRATARWFKKLLTIADGVAALPLETFTHLIDTLGPWNCSGVFCPNCLPYEKKSAFSMFTEPLPAARKNAGRTSDPFSATWGKSLCVRATVLTPCTEVITYPTPAWRDYEEVFAAPRKAFDTLVLRSRKKQSRFVVVYECYREKPALERIDLRELRPAVSVHIQERTGRSYELTIGKKETDSCHP